jgi:serine/threonine protein kinase
MSPKEALKNYRRFLSTYEVSEIASYSKVHYLSLSADQALLKAQHLRGFDEEDSNYKAVIGEHIAFRYELQSQLGKGSFSRVYQAQDHKTHTTVALKILKSGRPFRKAGTVEVELLKLIKEKDPMDKSNLVKVLKCLVFRKHICIVFELLSLNLREFLRQSNFTGSPLSLIRRFSVQILQGLRLLYRLRIVHCDLKPDNILLRHPSKSALKIVDLGSGCFEESKVVTYIQSRYYRAPEVVLGLPVTMKIDMWSFGCILAELYLGYPLFDSGDEAGLISSIAEMRGPFPIKMLRNATKLSAFLDDEGLPVFLSRPSDPAEQSKALEEVLDCPDAKFVDLISRCLEVDPDKRLSPLDALKHEWITEGAPEPDSKTSSPQPKSSQRVSPYSEHSPGGEQDVNTRDS